MCVWLGDLVRNASDGMRQICSFHVEHNTCISSTGIKLIRPKCQMKPWPWSVNGSLGVSIKSFLFLGLSSLCVRKQLFSVTRKPFPIYILLVVMDEQIFKILRELEVETCNTAFVLIIAVVFYLNFRINLVLKLLF